MIKQINNSVYLYSTNHFITVGLKELLEPRRTIGIDKIFLIDLGKPGFLVSLHPHGSLPFSLYSQLEMFNKSVRMVLKSRELLLFFGTRKSASNPALLFTSLLSSRELFILSHLLMGEDIAKVAIELNISLKSAYYYKTKGLSTLKMKNLKSLCTALNTWALAFFG